MTVRHTGSRVEGMGKESGRILECTDLQWSSRSEHARKYTYASTRVHSNASESPTAKRWPDVRRVDHKTGGQSTPRYQTSSAQ